MGVFKIRKSDGNHAEYYLASLGKLKAYTRIIDGDEETAKRIANEKFEQMKAKVGAMPSGRKRVSNIPRKTSGLDLPIGICIDWFITNNKYYPAIRLGIRNSENKELGMGRGLLRKGLAVQCRDLRNVLLENNYVVPSLNDFVKQIKVALLKTSTGKKFNLHSIPDFHLDEYA